MNIFFLRHGKTTSNEKGVYGGFTDVKLSTEGIEQAKNIAEVLKGETFDEIYVSPLRRTCETCQISGYEGVFDDRLREINFGIFEELSYEEILEKYPTEAKLWEKDFLGYKIPQGESLLELYHRVSDFIDEISKHEGKVLVVTHEGVIRCALSYVFEKPEYFYRFKIANCKLTHIAIDNDYKYIKAINSIEIII